LLSLDLKEDQGWIGDEFEGFRQVVRRWQGAINLPIDQLILSLAQDLFHEPPDLAIAHKLAILLRQAGEANSEWRLPDFTEELAVIARNERRFIGFSEDDTGFDPEAHKGQVVISTMHKAKGLEWDRVYLMSVNNYDFPSGQQYDRYIAEAWFMRDYLNLEAETIEQLQIALSPGEYDWYEEGRASKEARLDYISERLRLHYVGITRAKRELFITWNTGRDGKLLPAESLQVLMGFWEKRLSGLGGETE
jgi:DNA helicase-2/ATP-dependent DNA helicase PcrA